MREDVLWAAGVCALVAALGFDQGGYAASAWGWSGVAVLAVLAVLVARGAPRPSRPALVFVGSLAALGLWTAVSLLWTTHFSSTVLEIQRLLFYAAAAGLLVLARSAVALVSGVLAGITLLSAYALTQVVEGQRLAEPVGYANGIGILAAMGLLAAAALALRNPVAALPVPILAAALYFTFSRGAWLALALGIAVAVALAPARLRLAATALALAVPAALGVLIASQLGASPVLLAVMPLAWGAVVLVHRAPAPGARLRTAFAVALVILPAVVVAAGLAKVGGPEAAWRSFRGAPEPVHGEASGRVFDLSGRNRADYWSVAWRSYEHEPLLGIGAGSYGRAWLRERPVPQPVTDAHSLYLEMLAELGPVGLVLLLVALAAPFAGSRAEAVGPYAAFLAHTAQDWDWELPAVTIAALACAAAAFAGARGAPVPRVAAVVPAALGLLLVFAFLGNRALEQSIDAMDELRWEQAADRARSARRLQPWSPEPWRVLGEVELAEGSLAAARSNFRRGLEEDPDEFELWIGLGLASEGRDQRVAFERASRLNPLSPELEEVGFKTP
jgi:O-antigen ligase